MAVVPSNFNQNTQWSPQQPPGQQWDIYNAIPGLSGMTKSATDIIQNALTGLPSPDMARLGNAWFGAGSGLDPTSDFLRNRGFDLYRTQAEQRKRGGIQDLLGLVGGYSGTVAPTPGQQIGQQELALRQTQQQQEAERLKQQQQMQLAQLLGAGTRGHADVLSMLAGQLGIPLNTAQIRSGLGSLSGDNSARLAIFNSGTPWLAQGGGR